MLNNNTTYKYETMQNSPFAITQCWTNGMVTLQYGAIKIEYNIRRIQPYTYDTNIEDITP